MRATLNPISFKAPISSSLPLVSLNVLANDSRPLILKPFRKDTLLRRDSGKSISPSFPFQWWRLLSHPPLRVSPFHQWSPVYNGGIHIKNNDLLPFLNICSGWAMISIPTFLATAVRSCRKREKFASEDQPTFPWRRTPSGDHLNSLDIAMVFRQHEEKDATTPARSAPRRVRT